MSNTKSRILDEVKEMSEILFASGVITKRQVSELRKQQAGDFLLSIADMVALAGIEPMSMEDITAEVKAVRAERKQRADPD
jgi:hypothetical protein